jgi:hypothetical protein
MYLVSETSGVGLNLQVNDAGTIITPISVYSNGVVAIQGDLANNNKVLALKDNAVADNPTSATNFYGFGLNSSTLRYQTPLTSHAHRFYTGSTQAFVITNTGGANGSDSRWKTDVQNLSGCLAKIGQLQGKSFILNGVSQIGFIAQEVKEVVPEVVVVDENSEEQYHFLQYDKLTALLCEGIKVLVAEVNSLKARVATLEGQ